MSVFEKLQHNVPKYSLSIYASCKSTNKKLSYRRETARQLHTSFSAHSLIVHFSEHRICFYRAMLAQSAVMRLHVVCLSVRLSVCP